MGQVGKLGYVDAKLGATLPGQQTTRIVYNTIPVVDGSGTLEFFKSFNGLTLGQTNLTNNKLDSSESMVIKTITLYNIAYGGAYPLIDNQNASFELGCHLSVIVGNQEVVKKLPLQFNAAGNTFDRLHANNSATLEPVINPTAKGQFALPIEVRLLTDIVIPPQTSFTIKIERNGVAPAINAAATCVLSGYGKIFSAGSSF